MVKKANFVIPREHGAYIILLAAWLWGIIYSPVVSALGFAFVFAVALHLYLIQETVRRALRSGASPAHPVVLALGSGAIAASVILVIETPRIMLIAIPVLFLSILYFIFARKGVGPYLRSIVGFLALSLITPATILSTGSTDYLLIILSWSSVALFAVSSVLVVGIRLDQPQAQRRAAIFHIIYIGIIAGYSLILGILLPIVAMSVVTIVRYVLVAASVPRFIKLSIKSVGLLESLITILALAASALLV